MYGNTYRPWIIMMILMLSPWLMYARLYRIINRAGKLVPPGTLAPNTGVCESHHRCRQENRYNATVQPGDCFCDKLCSLYRDCCRGAEPFDDNPQNVTKLVQASSCEAIGKRTFHVVSSCPITYNHKHILHSCEHNQVDGDDWLLHTPVSEIRFGIVFKNVFCAICHGYGSDDVQFWMLKYRCYFSPANYTSIRQIQDKVEAREEMILTTLGPNYAGKNSTNNTFEEMFSMAEIFTKIPVPPSDVPFPRYCFPSNDSCPATWNDSSTQEQCLNGPQSVMYTTYNGVAYRNRHCAVCNGMEISSVVCERPGWPGKENVLGKFEPERPLQSLQPDSDFISITVLFDFNSQSLTIRDRLITKSRDCGKGAIYDLIGSKCRMLSCRVGMVLRDGRCYSESSDFNMTLPIGSRCPLVNITDIDYYIYPNGSLLLNKTGQIYGKRRYVYINDSLHLCIKDYIWDTLSFYGAYDLDVVQGMVSFAGQILSILGLVILILIYSCFPPLRTLPGQCLLCLASSLASAQTAFVVGMFSTEMDILCKSLAIFTHFSFLVSFCWMNVMAFDVWNTFRCKFSMATTSVDKFRIYACYCVSIPLFIVIFAIINDNIDTELVKPKYGKRFCWIGQKCALFYFFALPIGILLICNVTFFLMSVYHIFNASGDETVTRRRHGKRKRLILYTKLSTIMGLTWVFGYVGALTGSTVIWYLFIVCNSLQGLFICIAFLCNSKVHKLLSARLGKSLSRTSVISSTLSKSLLKQRSTSFPDKRKVKPELL